jgi:hypothetical protein
MSNAIDCSTMFDLPNPDEVEIVPVGTGFEVRHGTQLIWTAKSEVEAMVARNGYIENGV